MQIPGTTAFDRVAFSQSASFQGTSPPGDTTSPSIIRGPQMVSVPTPSRLTLARLTLATGLAGSLALLPLAWAQGSATRRRVPRLPAAYSPHHGEVPGVGAPLRVLAIGELSVSGVGLARGDETVTAVTARALARLTGRPVTWRACGLCGATVKDALERLLPRIAPEPADLLVVAFGVNDATSYRSPKAFADDLAALVTTARSRV